MNAGVIFERVYRALKEELGTGRFVAGQHLEPALLAQNLNASITPVRDALHRLAGEGLVETRQGDGFRTPPVTEVALRHLYRWNASLLSLALRQRSRAFAPRRSGEGKALRAPVEVIERLFLAIAARPGNPEHVAAIARLSERLRPIRQVEMMVLAGCDAEIEELAAWLGEDALPQLRRQVAAFHRRRERQVGEIVAALVAPR